MKQNILTLSLTFFLCLTIKETHQAFGYGKCPQAPVIQGITFNLLKKHSLTFVFLLIFFYRFQCYFGKY